MYPISVSTENLLRKRDRLWRIKAEIDGVEYAEDKIISFEIEQSIVSGQEFEIGAAPSSRLVIRLRTNAEITPNAKIVPYIALDAGDLRWVDADFAWEEADVPWEGGTTSWIPLGEFYVDSREKVNNTWEYTCYDKLMFANTPYVSSLTYPATMQAVWDEICTQLGYTYDSSVVIDPSYTVPVAPTGYTCRQVMGFIAAANAASVYAGRDGVIRFKRFSAAESPVFEMTPSDYIRARLTNPVKSFSRVVVVYDPDDDLAYEAGTGDEDHTLYVDCPFATQAIADNLLVALNGFAYVPVEMDIRGYPHLEPGDVIQFERDESMAWIDADIAWEDADFPWDGIRRYQTIILHQKMTFRGGLAMSIEAPSKSEQQSEFPVKGTLTEAIDRLNRNAVKQNKTYYGVTISPDYGLKVGRSDNLAEVVLNADEFRFTVEGENAFWLDVPNRRLKFSGTLEGADGIFSGTIQAGRIEGGSINAATITGGTISATTITGSTISGGSISGTAISGTIITGGSITGTTIQTNQSGVFPRIELSATEDFLSAYVSPSNYLRISTLGDSDPVIDFYSGGFVSSMVQYGPTLNLLTTNGLNLQGSQYFRLSGPVSLNGGIPLGSISVGNVGTPTVELVAFVLNGLLDVLRSMRILQPF
jgi:hypothetical protein